MKKIGLLVGGVIGGILLLVVILGAVDVNNEGYYTVKQGITGNVTVISKPGPYLALWGKLKVYPVSFETYLSSSDLDGGEGADTQAVKVIFNDGSYAFLSSVTKVTVPADEDIRMQIHRDFKSASAFQSNVRQYIEAIQKRSGSMFKAEEAYASKRTQLENIINSQLTEGKYATESITEAEATGAFGEDGEAIEVQVKKTIVKVDEHSQPIIEDAGLFRQYNLQLNYFNLKDVDPDEVTKNLIEQKKLAEQQRIVAQTQAEKSKQDALSAIEKGKADVATAEAEQLVIKKTAVIQAERNKEVATLKAQQELDVATLNKESAKQDAEARLIKEKAEADANKLKVDAGLTPQQKAEFDLKRADVVSKNLSSIDLPDMMIFGGGEGSPMNPFDAVGLESFIKIQEQLGQQ